MKIRAGFVSNSSSTSFLVVAKEDFTADALRRLMGVEDESPLASIFEDLYRDLLEGTVDQLDMSQIPATQDVRTYLSGGRVRLTDYMLARLAAERGKPVKVYVGNLSSDDNPVESFFCTDSFEEENDSLYINGLECAW